MRRLALLLIVIWSHGLCESAWAGSVQIADVTCKPKEGLFVLEYASPYGDGGEIPNIPSRFQRVCRLSHAAYRVIGVRGEFSLRHCGEQPPVSVAILRNRTHVVSDAVFGDNCYMGPAISSVEIKEGSHGIERLKLCILKSPNAEQPFCREFDEEKHQISEAIPIDQSKLNDYVAEHDR